MWSGSQPIKYFRKMFLIFFSDILTSLRMKLCAVVALFLIGIIPVKITHVYSQAELHWKARGSGRPPKIFQMIDISDSTQYVSSSIDRSPAIIPRGKPSIAKMPDNFREFSKQGFNRDLSTRMLIQLDWGIIYSLFVKVYKRPKMWAPI